MRRSRSDRQPTNDYREDNLQKNWDLTKVWVLRVNERIDIVRSKPMRFIAEKDIDSIPELLQVK